MPRGPAKKPVVPEKLPDKVYAYINGSMNIGQSIPVTNDRQLVGVYELKKLIEVQARPQILSERDPDVTG